MRKLFTLLFLLLIFGIYSRAQLVTITAQNQIPSPGTVITYQKASTFGFDPAGTGPVTNKTWDFAMLFPDGNPFTISYVNIAGQPFANNYPNANIAEITEGNSGYFAFEMTESKWNRWGFYSPGDNIWGIYNNGATYYDFPITAGQNRSFSYSGSFSPWNVGEDSVKITNGSISIQADAQGTLILPTGTFTNVLRLHIVETFRIKTYMMGMVVMDNVIQDNCYYWFKEGIMQPLLAYYVTTLDGSPQDPVLRYQILQQQESITLTSAPGTNNQIICEGNPITNITYSATGVTGANFVGLPNGISGSYNSGNIVISGTPTVVGTFNYQVQLVGGSENLTAQGSITINPLPVVTCPDVEITITENTPYQLQGATPSGGVYSGTGVSGNVFNPNGLQNGNYTVTYTYTDLNTNCSASCQQTIVVDIPTQISNSVIANVNIYPNPSNGLFSISNYQNISKIEICDISGRVIKDLSASSSIIDVQDLNSGNYFVKLYIENQIKIVSLFINK